MMELTIKDIVYLLTYIITIITLFLSFRNNLDNLSNSIRLIRDIIFGEKGSLNLVDQATLKAHLDQVWARIRRTEADMSMILQEMKDLNRNVMAIMFKLEVNVPDMSKIICKENDDQGRDN